MPLGNNYLIFCTEDLSLKKYMSLLWEKINNTKYHIGHIESDNHGGTIELSNCMPICPSCNGNETRNIIKKMFDDYGKTDYRTFIKIFKK